MASYLEPLMQYGVLGVFAVLLVMFARALLQREQQRGDAAAAEVQRLNNIMQEKTIPALLAATQAIAAAQTILQQIQYQRDVENAASKGINKP